MQSIKAIAYHLLTRESNPFRYFLTNKLSQDSIELLFNEIRHRCGVEQQQKCSAVQICTAKNLGTKQHWTIKKGNCTPFEDSLTQVGGLVSFSSKRQMANPVIETSDQNAILAEHMLLLNDINNPHPWKKTFCTTLLGTLLNHFWQKFLMRHAKGNYCLILLMLMLHNCPWVPCGCRYKCTKWKEHWLEDPEYCLWTNGHKGVFHKPCSFLWPQAWKRKRPHIFFVEAGHFQIPTPEANNIQQEVQWVDYPCEQTISETHTHKAYTFPKSVKTKELVCIFVHNTKIVCIYIKECLTIWNACITLPYALQHPLRIGTHYDGKLPNCPTVQWTSKQCTLTKCTHFI